MKTNKTILLTFFALLLILACEPSEENNNKISNDIAKTSSNPCNNPKTVKELLACANTVGEVDTYWVSVGSIFNQGSCSGAWNDQDTILNITYKDSVVLWRVNEKKNTPGHYSGSWFTNYSAKAAGLTKAETLDLFALNPCPDEKGSWDTCKCPTGKQPIDSVIQYEEKVKIAPQAMSFGIVGKSAFGKGGPVQWHILCKQTPPYRLLEQIRWE